MYSLIIFLCIMSGGYLVYAALVMKLRGRIIGSVVLKKGMDENAVRDKKGLVHYLYRKLLLFGIIIILSGIVNWINEYMAGPGIVAAAAVCAFAAAIVGYGIVTNTAMKRFLE